MCLVDRTHGMLCYLWNYQEVDMKSCCVRCTYCRYVHPRATPDMVYCAEDMFPHTLALEHPFIQLERICEKYDGEEEDDES